jgi:hypothetical protein
MVSKDAFSIGFVARCIERGLNGEQIKQAAAKAATLGGFLGGAATGLAGATMGLAKPALYAAMAAPPIAGGVLGYMAGSANDVDDTDVKDVQHQELLDTLNAETQKLHHAKAVRQLREGAQLGRPIG